MRDARTIAGMLSLPDVLRSIGAHTRAGRRADCPFCKGASRGTVSFNDRLWKCFRCNRGGDVFTLLQEKHGWDFKTALRAAADLAGVAVAAQGSAVRAAMLKRKRERERAECAARKLQATERRARLALAEESRNITSNQRAAGERLTALYQGDGERFAGEIDATESTLAACPDLLRPVLAAYSILSFAAQKDRVRFLLEPASRGEMIIDAMETGFVRDETGRVLEVLSA